MIDKSLLFKKNSEAYKKAIRAFRDYALKNEDASIQECWGEAEIKFRNVIQKYLSEFLEDNLRHAYYHMIYDDCRDGLMCQCKKEFLKLEKRRIWLKIQKVYVEQTVVPLLKCIDVASRGLYVLDYYKFDYQWNCLKISLKFKEKKAGPSVLDFHIKYPDLYSESINNLTKDIVKMMDTLHQYGPFIAISGKQHVYEDWTSI